MSLPAEVTRRIGPRNLRRVVYDAETIRRRIAELGREITGAYPGGDLLLVGLLKGSFMFLADLVREIERPLQVASSGLAPTGPGGSPLGGSSCCTILRPASRASTLCSLRI